MSLTQAVVALIEEAGRATADDILPDCEGYTREQVLRAIGNAQTMRMIRKVGTAGEGQAHNLGVYEPVPKPQGPRPVASVWEWASRV